jgi:hypothetical protein
MRALNSNVAALNKRKMRRVKLINIKSLFAVDKGATIYRIRVPLIEANAL